MQAEPLTRNNITASAAFNFYVFFHRGDYESSLVLYRRAERLQPRDVEHAVGARRAELAIQDSTAPRQKAQTVVELARRARSIVRHSEQAVERIPSILE